MSDDSKIALASTVIGAIIVLSAGTLVGVLLDNLALGFGLLVLAIGVGLWLYVSRTNEVSIEIERPHLRSHDPKDRDSGSPGPSA
jgi:hypothetical protein